MCRGCRTSTGRATAGRARTWIPSSGAAGLVTSWSGCRRASPLAPIHLHHFSEELFVILEGECTMRSDRGSWTVRAGSYIACPPGPSGAHKFTNENSADCVLLALGERLDHDVCEYPDSDKVGLRAGRFRKSRCGRVLGRGVSRASLLAGGGGPAVP